MSDFTRRTKNPKTGTFDDAEYLPHIYAVRFPDGTIYREDSVDYWETDEPDPNGFELQDDGTVTSADNTSNTLKTQLKTLSDTHAPTSNDTAANILKKPENINTSGEHIKVVDISVVSDQDKLIDLVSDPETIKRAVKGSMEKREPVLSDALQLADMFGLIYSKRDGLYHLWVENSDREIACIAPEAIKIFSGAVISYADKRAIVELEIHRGNAIGDGKGGIVMSYEEVEARLEQLKKGLQ